jgi:virulence factor
MRIAIIGLGDISKKAYLPVLSEIEGIELINNDTLNSLAQKYRIDKKVQSVDGLIALDIDAAFISTATEAHFEIAEKLLKNGIHVYIDKPISLQFH